MSDAKTAFGEIADTPGGVEAAQMFGRPCYQTGGKAFVYFFSKILWCSNCQVSNTDKIFEQFGIQVFHFAVSKFSDAITYNSFVKIVIVIVADGKGRNIR